MNSGIRATIASVIVMPSASPTSPNMTGATAPDADHAGIENPNARARCSVRTSTGTDP